MIESIWYDEGILGEKIGVQQWTLALTKYSLTYVPLKAIRGKLLQTL